MKRSSKPDGGNPRWRTNRGGVIRLISKRLLLLKREESRLSLPRLRLLRSTVLLQVNLISKSKILSLKGRKSRFRKS